MLLKSKCKIRQMGDRKSNTAKSRNGRRNYIFDREKRKELKEMLKEKIIILCVLFSFNV